MSTWRQSRGLARPTLYWTAAGALVAVLTLGLAVALAIWPSDDRADGTTVQQQQSGHSGNGDIQVNGDLNGNVYSNAEEFQDEAKGLTPSEAADAAKKYQNVAPPTGQPAPYLVVGAPRGLWVRSTGTVEGFHVGAAINGAVVWAECRRTTTFDPDPADHAGPVWLRIRWPTDEPNEALATSQPSSPHTSWVYTGHTVPSGHNGAVPECS